MVDKSNHRGIEGLKLYLRRGGDYVKKKLRKKMKNTSKAIFYFSGETTGISYIYRGKMYSDWTVCDCYDKCL